MENPPFEDVYPIKNGGFSIAMLVYPKVDGGFKYFLLVPRILGKDETIFTNIFFRLGWFWNHQQ